MPTPLLDMMRQDLEGYARHKFGDGYHVRNVKPAPPARQKRLYTEPPLLFPLRPTIVSRVTTRLIGWPKT